MTQEEKDKLVRAWIEYESAPDKERTRQERFEQKEKNFWAVEAFYELISDEPELVWELILQIHVTEHNDFVGYCLAAGPLEDLLAKYGEQFIGRVEAEARRDPKFRALVCGVWQNAMTEEVWERVCKICYGEKMVEAVKKQKLAELKKHNKKRKK